MSTRTMVRGNKKIGERIFAQTIGKIDWIAACAGVGIAVLLWICIIFG